jgi:hypothetical protein
MSAWDWLHAELERLLGEERAAALWKEYRARAQLDLEATKVREHQRRAAMGIARSQQWLADNGYTPTHPDEP